MRGHRIRGSSSAVALIVLLLVTGCGDSFGPRVGSQYVLRSINGRALPTSPTVAPPTDTLFTVYSEAQYRVVSDSIIAYDLRVDLISRHADGSTQSVPATCWDNFPYLYTRQGDSLILIPHHPGTPPPPAPTIRLSDGALLATLDTREGRIQMRFELDDRPTQPCGGFMQVAEK